jgi:hypothetical protein
VITFGRLDYFNTRTSNTFSKGEDLTDVPIIFEGEYAISFGKPVVGRDDGKYVMGDDGRFHIQVFPADVHVIVEHLPTTPVTYELTEFDVIWERLVLTGEDGKLVITLVYDRSDNMGDPKAKVDEKRKSEEDTENDEDYQKESKPQQKGKKGGGTVDED